MSLLLAAVLLSPAPPADAETWTREVPVAVFTKEGESVADVSADELELKEDGKKRKVIGIRPDDRSVDVAVILDSSQWMDDQYRQVLVPYAVDFWKALPPKARVTVWTSGGRAHRAVDFGMEPEAAQAKLQKAASGGPLFTLEAIIAASEQLKAEGAHRRVMVIVTGDKMPLSQTMLDKAFQALADARVTPMVLLIKGYTGTGGGMRLGGRSWDTESILEQMATGYGGAYDLVLSAQASDKVLKRIAAGLTSQYLVRFESLSEKPSHPEVKVDRKDVRARAGLAMLAY